jgi:hypothetical protein
MDERPEPGTEDRHASTEEPLDLGLEDPRVMTWFAEHMPELQRSASGQRLLYQSLAFAFALGLAAHIGGYALAAYEAKVQDRGRPEGPQRERGD